MNEYEKLKLFIYECGMTEENVNYTIDLMETCNVIDQSLLIESVKNFVYIVEKKTEESYRKKEFKKYFDFISNNNNPNTGSILIHGKRYPVIFNSKYPTVSVGESKTSKIDKIKNVIILKISMLKDI